MKNPVKTFAADLPVKRGWDMNHGRLRTLATALTLTIALVGAARLGAQIAIDQQNTTAWFVELNGTVDTFRAQARGGGIEFSERYVYGRLWKGLSINATSEAANSVRTLSSVKAVYPVVKIELAPVDTISPQLAHALQMTGADLAQASRWSGAGIKVGVIDTGVDYHHPDLGGSFGPGGRVVTGYDFVGDAYNSSGSGGALIPHPDGDPDDCNSHGTHVAGIVGASGTPPSGARGVAPGVTFGAYRVFGCTGTTDADIMIAAMERALADGMHVVNMSIGAAFVTWPQYPTAVAADALVDAGVVVVTSIGNSGASGLYSASAPGVGRKVIGTASVENTHVQVASFIANPGGAVIGYTPLGGPAGDPGPPPPPTSGTTPQIVFVGRGCVDGDLATAGNQTDPYLADPAGKVALITRGVCPFNEKYARAADAGAAGVIIENNAPGVFFGGFTVGRGIFGIGISQADGTLLKGLSAPTATWTDDMIDVPNPISPGRAASSSSYGLTAELDLKPDIAAPGGFIRSTIPLELGGYRTLSGTSMASPHVAGAVALLLEAKPGTSPAMVRTILQNSADPFLFGTSASFLETLPRQGAGLVDIDDAIAADTLVTPGKISLGEGTGGSATLSITNSSAVTRTYALAHNAAVSTLGTFAPGFFTLAATAQFTRAGSEVTSVEVAGGATEEVDVTISRPFVTGGNGLIYGGYLRITDTASGKVYRVPYAGLLGDYQLIRVLAPGGCNFPGLFKLGGETECVPAGPTTPAVVLPGVTRQGNATIFNVEDRNDRPVILFHLAHQSQRLEIRAVNVATNESYLVASGEYLGRHATNTLAPGSFGSYRWDGKQVFRNAVGLAGRKEVPTGLYHLQVRVTKALADPNDPNHTEIWNSPVMNIVRITE